MIVGCDIQRSHDDHPFYKNHQKTTNIAGSQSRTTRYGLLRFLLIMGKGSALKFVDSREMTKSFENKSCRRTNY